MRILQVTPVYYPEVKFGGPPRKIHGLSQGFQKRGHDVQVVTFHSEHPQLSEVRDVESVKVTYLPWIGKGTKQWPVKKAALVQLIKQADIVHCYGLYNFICPPASRMGAKYGKAVVLEPLGMYKPKARSLLAKRLYHALYTNKMLVEARSVICASEAEKTELMSVIPAEKLTVRRNGIDVSEYQGLQKSKIFRDKQGIPSEAFLILFMGRISPIKNLEQLIHAFANAAIQNGYLVMVGPALEPGYTKELNGLVQSLNLTRTVKILEPLYDKEKLEALASADLFVLPSLSESFGNAAAEAVAAEIPVLLTDTCGIAPVIHGKAGLAVECSVAGLTQGLKECSNPIRVEELTAGRSAVIEQLSWEQPITQTLELYAKLLQ
jgi:glycosyltransferase involved in cell wall biosynthesis